MNSFRMFGSFWVAVCLKLYVVILWNGRMNPHINVSGKFFKCQINNSHQNNSAVEKVPEKHHINILSLDFFTSEKSVNTWRHRHHRIKILFIFPTFHSFSKISNKLCNRFILSNGSLNSVLIIISICQQINIMMFSYHCFSSLIEDERHNPLSIFNVHFSSKQKDRIIFTRLIRSILISLC
jgi:hypothetical protein